jgi:hypothetical protein
MPDILTPEAVRVTAKQLVQGLSVNAERILYKVTNA